MVALEVSFSGAGESEDGAPRKTRVVATCWRRIEHAPEGWVELWCVRHGNLAMPGAPWHGFSLTAVARERLYAALGNELVELDADSGDRVWRRATGNTPIWQVLHPRSGELLVVQHGYHGFDYGAYPSNLCALSLEGELRWHAELPHHDDSFCNWVHAENDSLVTTTWNGFECRLSAADGSLLEKRWTK